MLNFLKLIFPIFIFTCVSSPSFSQRIEDDGKPIPNVDDLLKTPDGFIEKMWGKQDTAEAEYENALKIIGEGQITTGLDTLIRLEKSGHAGSKTTLEIIKKQKPKLVEDAYNRVHHKILKDLYSEQTRKNEEKKNIEKPVPDIKETEKKQAIEKPPEPAVISEPAVIKDENSLDNSEIDNINPKKDEINSEQTKKNGKKKNKEKKKDLTKSKNFLKNYSLHYLAVKDENSSFSVRNREMVNSLVYNAKNGHAKSAYMLGLMASDGVFVEKDLAAALIYLEQACDLNFYEACNNVGHFYRFGLIEKDLKKAEKYLLKSALAGDKYAIYNLATLYFYDGNIDYVKSYLFSLSALDKLNNSEEKEYAKRALNISKASLKKMSFFQKAYVKSYYPKPLIKLLNAEYKRGKIWAEPVSLPQNNDGDAILNIKNILPIRKTDKRTENLFLKWKYPVNPKENFAIVGKDVKLPSLNPNSPEAVYGQMYRYDTPYQMVFTLVDKYSTITARVGDKIIINVLGTIFGGNSDISDEKQTNIREKTGIGVITTAISKRVPMVKEQSYKDFLGYSYEIFEKGVGEITYTDTLNPENSYKVIVLVE